MIVIAHGNLQVTNRIAITVLQSFPQTGNSVSLLIHGFPSPTRMGIGISLIVCYPPLSSLRPTGGRSYSPKQNDSVFTLDTYPYPNDSRQDHGDTKSPLLSL